MLSCPRARRRWFSGPGALLGLLAAQIKRSTNHLWAAANGGGGWESDGGRGRGCSGRWAAQTRVCGSAIYARPGHPPVILHEGRSSGSPISMSAADLLRGRSAGSRNNLSSSSGFQRPQARGPGRSSAGLGAHRPKRSAGRKPTQATLEIDPAIAAHVTAAHLQLFYRAHIPPRGKG